MRYALIYDGKVVNTILADENYTPEAGFSIAAFDPEIHSVTAPAGPTERWVSSYRFLFELHSMPQYLQLDALRAAADQLTLAQISDMTPGAVDSHGVPLDILRVIRVAYQQMRELGGRLDVLSHGAALFFAAGAASGLYGQTSEEIAAEIARIQSDTVPT